MSFAAALFGGLGRISLLAFVAAVVLAFVALRLNRANSTETQRKGAFFLTQTTSTPTGRLLAGGQLSISWSWELFCIGVVFGGSAAFVIGIFLGPVLITHWTVFYTNFWQRLAGRLLGWACVASIFLSGFESSRVHFEEYRRHDDP